MTPARVKACNMPPEPGIGLESMQADYTVGLAVCQCGSRTAASSYLRPEAPPLRGQPCLGP